MVRVKHYPHPLQLGTVKACGHKFDNDNPPRLNCAHCWDAYFMVAVDTVAVHDDLSKGGKKQLEKVYGTKFTKQFGRFLNEQLTKGNANNNESEVGDGNSVDQLPHSN